MPILALIFILCLSILVYLPGLDGPFFLDDFATLVALDDYGGVHDWETFRLFVFGGIAGPSGRPISLLSFLIDGTSFENPWRFKLTNVLMHLLNGLLLFWLVLLVESFRTDVSVTRRTKWIALLVAGTWLLHPFNVSTTLYVVQRMAQLSSLFVLAGLIAYLLGRKLLVSSPIKAYLFMSCSIVIATGKNQLAR